MNTQISSTTYLCDKERIMQTQGLAGELHFDGQKLTFKSSDNTKNIVLSNDDISLVDMNNIMGAGQIVFHTVSNMVYVFVFYEPQTNAESLSKGLLGGGSNTSVSRNIDKFSEMSDLLDTAKSWRKTMIGSLPKSKLKYRKELRVIRVVLMGIGIPLAIIACAVTLLILFVD